MNLIAKPTITVTNNDVNKRYFSPGITVDGVNAKLVIGGKAQSEQLSSAEWSSTIKVHAWDGETHLTIMSSGMQDASVDVVMVLSLVDSPMEVYQQRFARDERLESNPAYAKCVGHSRAVAHMQAQLDKWFK